MSRRASHPLRQLTEEETQELQRVSRACSEPRNRHQRAVALLAVAGGKSLSEAARLAGWKNHDPVTRLTRRFNLMGLLALDDLPRSGAPRRYGPAERARILQEARQQPSRKEDATATWSLTLLQRALRAASDGLPKVSTFTILHTLHEAGYRWQKDRSWCHTGRMLKKGKDGTVYQSEDPYTQEKNRQGKSRVPLSVIGSPDSCSRDVTFAPTEKNQRGKRSSTPGVLVDGEASGARMVGALDHAQALLAWLVSTAPTSGVAVPARMA